MTEKSMLLDPTSEQTPKVMKRLDLPESLEGLTLGLLDISKAQGDIFLNRIEELSVQKGLKIKRFTKPTFSRVAPTELYQEIASEVDVVIEGLAD